MEDPAATTALCGMIADHFRTASVTTVVGPAMGGVILAYETARQLGVRDIFAEKGPGGELIFDRGFEIERDQPMLVVDDVLTTGGSVKRTLALLHEAGAKVLGVGFLIDRTNGAVDFGVPSFACHRMDIKSYAPDECPLCKQGLPLIET